jgi:hypothetical protein
MRAVSIVRVVTSGSMPYDVSNTSMESVLRVPVTRPAVTNAGE